MAKNRSVNRTSRELILLECGYRCTVPSCRALTALDVHPLDEQAGQESDEADNLVCLCLNCYNRYYHEAVPSLQVMRAYKFQLQEMSRAVNRESIDLLFYLTKIEWLTVSGDKVAEVAALLNAGYMYADYKSGRSQVTADPGSQPPQYRLKLTHKGRQFLDAWHNGDPEFS